MDRIAGALALLITLGCTAVDDNDLGELGGDNADIGEFDVRVKLAAGESDTFRIRAAGTFTVSFTQPNTGGSLGSPLELSVVGESGDRHAQTLAEPSVGIQPVNNSSIQYTIDLRNTGNRAIDGRLKVTSGSGPQPSGGIKITGYVIGIVGGFNESAAAGEARARKSHQFECDAWIKTQTDLFGADRIIQGSARCGELTNVLGSSTLFEFESTPSLNVDVPAGVMPIMTTVKSVQGGSDTGLFGRFSSFAAWHKVCDETLAGLQAVYGDRLLAGACKRPKNVSSRPNDVFIFRGDLVAHIAPLTGTRFTVTGFIRGEFTAFGSPSDFAQYTRACDVWMEKQRNLSGVKNIESQTCGTPDGASSSSGGDLFGEASYNYVLPAPDTHRTFVGATVTGEQENESAAVASWVAACDAEIARQKQTLGSRFLAAACARPINLFEGQSAGPQFQADVIVHARD